MNPSPTGTLHRSLAFCLGLFALTAVGAPAAAQITTNTALPVTKGQGIVRFQAKVLRATDDPSPMDRSLTVLAFPVIGVYGVHPRLAVFVVVPVLDKNLEVTLPQGRVERGPSGLGDVRLFARYTLYQHNVRGQTIRLAPLVGIELPTGDDAAEDELGRLPPPLQLGSGSWDPLAGLVLTWQTLAWQLDVSSTYQYNTEANDFQFGDEARLDAAFKLRLWPRELGGGVPGFLYANLETNLIWEDESQAAGAAIPGTGGTTLYVAPGIQYITRRFVIEAAVQVPLLQDLGGDALRNNFITILSLRLNI